jgi:hypothetical protein
MGTNFFARRMIGLLGEQTPGSPIEAVYSSEKTLDKIGRHIPTEGIVSRAGGPMSTKSLLQRPIECDQSRRKIDRISTSPA